MKLGLVTRIVTPGIRVSANEITDGGSQYHNAKEKWMQPSEDKQKQRKTDQRDQKTKGLRNHFRQTFSAIVKNGNICLYLFL